MCRACVFPSLALEEMIPSCFLGVGRLSVWHQTMQHKQQIKQALHLLRRAWRHENDRMEEGRKVEWSSLVAECEALLADKRWPGFWHRCWLRSWVGRVMGRGSRIDPALAAACQSLVERVEAWAGRVLPAWRSSAFADNIDVILVALVVAAGVRTYIVQPFKIPTNSMFPSLRGVVVEEVDPTVPLPSAPQRWVERLLLGRSHVDLTIPAGAAFVGSSVSGQFLWRKVTLSFIQDNAPLEFTLWTEAEVRDLMEGLKIPVVRGSSLQVPVRVRGIVSTGDHLFVDKVSYNFVRPSRGDAFVFRTAGLATAENMAQMETPDGSQYYIKRCVAVGGDRVQVMPPELWINGAPASESSLRRVWSGEPYKGYVTSPIMNYLRHTGDLFEVPADCFWAMGDNSRNSADSRLFGPVPLENLMGRAMILYFPLGRTGRLID